MKNIKYIIGAFLSFLLLFNSCQDDEYPVGDILAPSNIEISVTYIDEGGESAAPGLGSGEVMFSASADNATAYHFVIQKQTKLQKSGSVNHTFTTLGTNTYAVTAIAYGTGGNSSSKTIEVEVLALYEAPADLLDMLHGGGEKSWRIKAESKPHFGLGPPGGSIIAEWYSAGPNEKASAGMYDDRYIFSADGTFTHITNIDSGDNTGTIFGRVGLIDELGSTGGTVDGADVSNLPYNDYSENWTLTAPGDVETLSLSGIGFLGYYTGGNHQYKIFSRTATEMVVSTADGNGEFEWWFTLTTEEEGANSEFESEFNTLAWSDEFDTAGAPDVTKWTYDLGAGGWGNGELQTYTDNAENVIIEDGSLKITAKADGTGYTSARLKSKGLQEFTYGRVEVRAKLPAAQGTWPAIWMLGSNFDVVGWPASGEIDIMEQTGQDKSVTSGALHLPGNSGGNAITGATTNTTSTTEFHNYTVEWTATAIQLLVDDSVFLTFTNTPESPFNADFFMILNVAMGGSLGGTVDPAFTEDTMEIDYVRVYQ
ncbi:Glycosyl hydrolases family 16 [Flaviramulus basaltis]|uniref:Glycosyl hydrolases family 16 n=1 Tax=Flaviramulus basaltis TaxID=369401 RepID=A0A1K2IHR7_9FLAO|nr:glycoside hydrolase family 16 protein [Flaviramulus basaltis]SFZ91846.1 Glycosyl hydrolases family 16 [Flaviramulus basaltis]